MATRHRFQVDGQQRTVVVEEAGDGLRVAVDDADAIIVDATSSGIPGLISMLVDGRPQRAYVTRRGQGLAVTVEGRTFVLHPAASARARGAVGGATDPAGQISAPLAGVVVEIRTPVGTEVKAGDTVVVVEAMKMQNEVQAREDGTVTAVHCEQGARVEKGDLLLEYDPPAS